jgi:hypothetical protein
MVIEVWQTIAILCLGCFCVLWVASREQRKSIAQRRGLLDQACNILEGTRFSYAADGHPVVFGRMVDGTPVKLEVITDTLITRRLPQLWLRVTLFQDLPALPSLGLIARPTGAEFYSVVHDFTDWIAPPPSDVPALMRGNAGSDDACWEGLRQGIVNFTADNTVKELVVGANFVRIVIQAAQGEPASHLLLRQARFSIQAIAVSGLRKALGVAGDLRELASGSHVRQAG